MFRSTIVFELASLPYELLASAPVWERHCAQMAAELPPGARLVLDLGCGPGNSTAHLRASIGRGAIGGDYAMPMLRRARRRGVPLAAMDAGALPVRSGSLDAVTFHSVLYLLPDRAAALREVFRVLRPGGRAVLLEPQAGLKATVQGMAHALRDAALGPDRLHVAHDEPRLRPLHRRRPLGRARGRRAAGREDRGVARRPRPARGGGEAVRILHFSDPHVQLPGWRERPLRELGPLRALATVELWKGRGRDFDDAFEKLKAIARDADALKADLSSAPAT